MFRMLYYCIIPLVVSGMLGKSEKVEEGRRLMGKVRRLKELWVGGEIVFRMLYYCIIPLGRGV